MSENEPQIEFSKASPIDMLALRAMERRSINRQLHPQLWTSKHNLGLPSKVLTICLDEITDNSAIQYANAMHQRCDDGVAFAGVARNQRTGKLEAMIEVALRRRGTPFYEVAALHSQDNAIVRPHRDALLSGLLGLFEELYDDVHPIKATIFGWRSGMVPTIDSEMLAFYERQDFKVVKPDSEFKTHGCLQMTRIVKERGQG